MLSVLSSPLFYVRYTPSVRIIWRLAALILAVLIAQQSLSVSNAVNPVPYMDKIVHFVAYAVLGVFALPALPRLSPILVVLGLGLFGALLEIGQGLMDVGRKPELLDAGANMAGAIAALAFWAFLTKLKT